MTTNSTVNPTMTPRNLIAEAIYEAFHALMETKAYVVAGSVAASFWLAVMGFWQQVADLREVLYVSPFYLWLLAMVMAAGWGFRLIAKYLLQRKTNRPKISTWLVVNTLTWVLWLLFLMFAANTVQRIGGEIARDGIMVAGLVPFIMVEFYLLSQFWFGEEDTARGYLKRILRLSRVVVAAKSDVDAALKDLAGDDGAPFDGKGETPETKQPE